MNNFNTFAQNMKRYYVFDIKYKDKSAFMKLLGFLLFFNKNFMISYITTIGNTIYFPSERYIKNNERSAIGVLVHEIVHVAQSEKYGKILFSLMYLFPQCLALLAFGAVFATLWLPMLWCLVFLVFLAPIPAPWRTKFEIDGYTMSLFMINTDLRHRGYTVDNIEKELLVKAVLIDSIFKSSNYWFMWPFGVEKVFEKKINDICNGVISDTDEIYGRANQSYLDKACSSE